MQPVGNRRIISLLPSATEMLCALDPAENIVGISHECDYPEAIPKRATIIRPVLALEHLTQAEIDHAVSSHLHDGQSLYQLDEQLLKELAPDTFITQDLCQVCAPSGSQLSNALARLTHKPKALSLSPKSLAQVLKNILEIGEATPRLIEGTELLAHLIHPELFNWAGPAGAYSQIRSGPNYPA